MVWVPGSGCVGNLPGAARTPEPVMQTTINPAHRAATPTAIARAVRVARSRHTYAALAAQPAPAAQPASFALHAGGAA